MGTTALQYTKKLASTVGIAVIVMALMLLLSGRARSFLTFIGNDLTFTGTVTQVNPNSFMVDKGGTYPFTIVTDAATDYQNGLTRLADVSLGEKVVVEAREHQGMLLAEEVSPVIAGGYGYGAGCEAFEGSKLWVSAIEDGSLYLSRAGITFYVQYDGNTEVMPGEQSIYDLEVGETIAVSGEDCQGEGINAHRIIRANAPPTEVTACTDLDGHIIGNSQVLLSHDEYGAFTAPQMIDVPAGVYDVYGVSFDSHSENAWDTQDNERWYVEGWYNDEIVYTSDATDDLPDGIDSNVTMIGSSVYVSDMDALRFAHAAYVDPAYHSIWPECVAFVPVEPIEFGLIENTADDAEEQTTAIENESADQETVPATVGAEEVPVDLIQQPEEVFEIEDGTTEEEQEETSEEPSATPLIIDESDLVNSL